MRRTALLLTGTTLFWLAVLAAVIIGSSQTISSVRAAGRPVVEAPTVVASLVQPVPLVIAPAPSTVPAPGDASANAVCSAGLLSADGLACCLLTCGVCGGPSCAFQPGGRKGCCARRIRVSASFCSDRSGRPPCRVHRVGQSPHPVVLTNLRTTCAELSHVVTKAVQRPISRPVLIVTSSARVGCIRSGSNPRQATYCLPRGFLARCAHAAYVQPLV